MARYKVEYVQTVEHTYEALVEADSLEEARRKIEVEQDFLEEEEINWQGLSIEISDVEKVEVEEEEEEE